MLGQVSTCCLGFLPKNVTQGSIIAIQQSYFILFTKLIVLLKQILQGIKGLYKPITRGFIFVFNQIINLKLANH